METEGFDSIAFKVFYRVRSKSKQLTFGIKLFLPAVTVWLSFDLHYHFLDNAVQLFIAFMGTVTQITLVHFLTVD